MHEEEVTGLVRVLTLNPQTHFSGVGPGRAAGPSPPGDSSALSCLRRMALCFLQPSNPRTWMSTKAASAAPPGRTA